MRIGQLSTRSRAIVVVALVVVVSGTLFVARSNSATLTFGQEFRDELPDILVAASEFQREILEDGEVTPEENDEAFDQFRACVSDAGVTIVDFDRDEHGILWSLSFGGVSDRAAAERADGLVSECRLEFLQYVEYARRATLDPEGTALSYVTRIVECLRAAGMTVEGSPGTEQELMALTGIEGGEPSVPVGLYIGCTQDAQVP